MPKHTTNNKEEPIKIELPHPSKIKGLSSYDLSSLFDEVEYLTNYINLVKLYKTSYITQMKISELEKRMNI